MSNHNELTALKKDLILLRKGETAKLNSFDELKITKCIKQNEAMFWAERCHG